MNHYKKTKKYSEYKTYIYLSDISVQKTFLEYCVDSIIIENKEELAYLLFNKKNRVLNYLNYKRLLLKNKKNKMLYSQEQIEKTIPLEVLTFLVKIYPQDLIESLVEKNKELTYLGLGFSYKDYQNLLYFYLENYNFKPNNFKPNENPKLSKEKKKEQILKIIKILYEDKET